MERTVVESESFWTRRSVWLSVAVVVVVAAMGYLLDRLLVREGMPRRDMLLLTNTITGIVAGTLFFYHARHEKNQRELVRERMKTIAELNHHIRNALQVIKLCGEAQDPVLQVKSLQWIKESADRIEWALREVLPRYPVNEGELLRYIQTGYAAVNPPIRQRGPFSDEVHETRFH